MVMCPGEAIPMPPGAFALPTDRTSSPISGDQAPP